MDELSDQEAWHQLERGLKEAASLRVADPRAAAKRAVEAILHLLYQKPQWTAEGIHRPLVDLFAGLKDRDKGRLAPLLSPTKFQNRHTDAALLQMMQGYAIFAMEQLVEMGKSVEAANEQVTSVWNERSGEPRKSGTIKSWYNRRNNMRKDDLGFEALVNLRALWHPQNLDKSSADIVKNAVRENGLGDNLNEHLPRTEVDILGFLARALTVIKAGHKLPQ